MTPSGIDPATLRFVAQCLNHCATAIIWRVVAKYIEKEVADSRKRGISPTRELEMLTNFH
jgi:hypothetical protein